MQTSKSVPAPNTPSRTAKPGAATQGAPYRAPRLTFGQKAADALTGAVGSWTFLGILSIVLIAWIALNSVAMFRRWDPYPFILLNLILSFVAAYQAPIILMSQGRNQDRDRVREGRDHAVNRKAEREVRDMQADLEEIKTMIRRLDRRINEVRKMEKDEFEAAKDCRRKNLSQISTR